MSLNMSDPHRIKRLAVAVRAADQAAAGQLQQQVSTFCRTELPDLLQSAFDGIAADRWLRIDRLELSLPAFADVDECRRRLGERVRQALQPLLDDAAAAAAAADNLATLPPAGQKAPPRVFDAAYRSADLFSHLLAYGVAPWHAAGADFDASVQAVIGILKTDPVFRQELAALLSKPSSALQRFVLQTRAADRRRIVSLIARLDQPLIEDVERTLQAVATQLAAMAAPVPDRARLIGEIAVRHLVRRQTVDENVRVAVLSDLLQAVLSNGSSRGQPAAVDLPLVGMQLEAVLPRRWHPALQESIAGFAVPGPGLEDAGPAAAGREPAAEPGADFKQRDTGIDAVRGDPEKDAPPADPSDTPGRGPQPEDKRFLRQSAGDADAPHAGLPPDMTDGKASPLPAEQLRDGDPMRAFSVGKARAGQPAAGGSSSDTVKRAGTEGPPEPGQLLPWQSPLEAESVHVGNAGLVLLAPFFGMVFKDLGYLDKRRAFASDRARVRAVHLSQYLVTGRQHPAENQLVLNKVLCGMPVTEPVERFVDLNVNEIDAAGEVLDSAIAHWSVLKRTSVPVFRQTFLQHEGILGRNGQWLLRIERTAVDVLIDTLPWTISIIKHPWMQQPLMVQW